MFRSHHIFQDRLIHFIPKYYALLSVLLILTVTFLYTAGFFQDYIKTDFVSGWDGAQHYAVNKVYSDKIFPRLSGIEDNWYAGMPWPVFYPPLFTYSMAVLAHILPFTYFQIFKWLFVILTFVFPLLVYKLVGKLEMSKLERLLAALFSVLFLASAGDQAGTLGVTMGGTFENGLYPQFFASIFLLLWLIVFLDCFRNKKYFIASVFLFALVLISNVHIAQPAALVFGVFTVLKSRVFKRRAVAKKYLAHLVLSVILAAFWYIPMIRYNDYFLTKAIGNVPLYIAVLSMVVPLTLGFASGFYALKYRLVNNSGIFISSLIIFLLTVTPLSYFFPSIPLQPFRIFPIAYLFLMILAPRGIFILLDWLSLQGMHAAIGFVIIVAPILYWYPPVYRSISGIYHLSANEHRMIDYISHLTDGRSIFEVWLDDNPTPYLPKSQQPTHFILSALVGAQGTHETLWGAFRESSLLAPFAQPLRNSFSLAHESYGVTCWLCTDEKNQGGYKADEFYSQPFDNHLKRASLLGVKYVVSRTDLNTKLLSEHIGKDFALKETFPPWTLFELPHADTKPISLEYEPVLTFTSLRAKDRPPEGLEAYDWLRLNEEWFLNADFRYVLARPEDIFLDDAPDLRHFKIALLTQYEYIDETRAFYTVSHFAREHYVLLLESPDPLYRRLTHDTSIPKDHILTIPRTGDPRKDFKVILARLDGLHLKTNTTRWELMKTAFFPTYRRAGDAPVYLASPALTLRTHF